MPTLNLMPKENLTIPRLSVSIYMIVRLLLLCLNIIIIGIIGYYFAYYLGSYRHNLFHEELMMLVCAVSAFINTVIMVIAAMTSSSHQAGGTLATSYAELISNGVSAFLLIIAGMVLLIQMSIYGRYFLANYEAKVFSGVLALVNGVFYIVFSLFLYRQTNVSVNPVGLMTRPEMLFSETTVRESTVVLAA